MCDEVIFRGRYLHTVEDLQIALEGGEIVSNHQYGYTEDDLPPHCCLCPVDLAQAAAKLRPGGGTLLHGWGPNESCPYIPPNINESERQEEQTL